MQDVTNPVSLLLFIVWRTRLPSLTVCNTFKQYIWNNLKQLEITWTTKKIKLYFKENTIRVHYKRGRLMLLRKCLLGKL